MERKKCYDGMCHNTTDNDNFKSYDFCNFNSFSVPKEIKNEKRDRYCKKMDSQLYIGRKEKE